MQEGHEVGIPQPPPPAQPPSELAPSVPPPSLPPVEAPQTSREDPLSPPSTPNVNLLNAHESVRNTPEAIDAGLASIYGTLAKANQLAKELGIVGQTVEQMDNNKKYREAMTDPAKRELLGFRGIARAATISGEKEITYNSDPRYPGDKGDKPIYLKLGPDGKSYVLVTPEEARKNMTRAADPNYVIVTLITKNENGMLTCDLSDGQKNVLISANTVATGQFLTMYDAAKGSALFSADETKVIDAYVAALFGDPTKAQTIARDPEQQQLITRMAYQEGGAPLLKDLMGSTDRRKIPVSQAPGATQTEKEQNAAKQHDQIDMLLAQEGLVTKEPGKAAVPIRLVVQPEAVANIENIFIPGDVEITIKKLNEQIQEITYGATAEEFLETIQGSKRELDKQRREKVKDLQSHIGMLEDMQKAFKKGEATIEFYAGLQHGDRTIHQAQGTAEALRNGESRKLVEAVTDSKFLTEAEKEERRNFFSKHGKEIGFGGILLSWILIKQSLDRDKKSQ